jgi:hypothetical protein
MFRVRQSEKDSEVPIYDPSASWVLLVLWFSVTSEKTWIFSSNAVRISEVWECRVMGAMACRTSECATSSAQDPSRKFKSPGMLTLCCVANSFRHCEHTVIHQNFSNYHIYHSIQCRLCPDYLNPQQHFCKNLRSHSNVAMSLFHDYIHNEMVCMMW